MSDPLYGRSGKLEKYDELIRSTSFDPDVRLGGTP
jgi:hypothetical protein